MRRKGRSLKQANDGGEALGTHHEHLGILPRDIGDARVVEVVVGLERRNQHRILAALFGAIGVQLLEVVLVALAACGRRRLLLVLHLEHDGEQLVAVFVVIAEDEVSLGATHGLVVLFKEGPRVGLHADAVELVLAMMLKRLAHQLGGEAHAIVTQALDLGLVLLYLLILGLELFLRTLGKLALAQRHLLAQVCLRLLAVGLLNLELRLQLVVGTLELGRGLEHIGLRLRLEARLLRLELGFERCLTCLELRLGTGKLVRKVCLAHTGTLLHIMCLRGSCRLQLIDLMLQGRLLLCSLCP